MGAVVSIVKGKNVEKMVKKAVELVGGMEKVVAPNKKVLIKPNLSYPLHPNTGCTTDPRIVESLIKILQNLNAREIVVGDGTGKASKFDTMSTYRITNLDKVCERFQLRFVDFNTDRATNVKIETGKVLKEIKIAKTVLDADIIINVPKMKTHWMIGVTACIKNLMGCVVGEDRTKKFHDKRRLYSVHQHIVDLNKVIRPALHVVDGIIGMQGRGPGHGTPIAMGLIIAGRDPVAVDTVTTRCMGYDHRKIDYIRYAAEQGLGTMNLDEIKIVGEKIEDVKKTFYFESNTFLNYWMLLPEL